MINEESRATNRATMRSVGFMRAVLGAAVFFGTIACSKNDATSSGSGAATASATAPVSTRTASCDRVPSSSLCSEYLGSYLAQNEAVLSATCQKLGGTFVRAECPNTSVLGSCTLSTTEIRKFYGSGAVAYDVAKAEKECTTSYKGKWAPFQ